MTDPSSSVLRVYVDADVILAGAASPAEYSASQVLLTLSEITLIEGLTSELAIEECRRNLEASLPAATGPFEQLVDRALMVVSDSSTEEIRSYAGKADEKDLPHLTTAIREDCSVLVTYNTADYQPGVAELSIRRPGALVRQIRERLGSI